MSEQSVAEVKAKLAALVEIEARQKKSLRSLRYSPSSGLVYVPERRKDKR